MHGPAYNPVSVSKTAAKNPEHSNIFRKVLLFSQLLWLTHDCSLDRYFSDKTEFSPDLILLDGKLQDLGSSFKRISEFDVDLPLSAFIELKATSTSFRCPKKDYLADTAKLQLLSDYWTDRSGTRPQAIQVIFNWKSASGNMVEESKLERWFSGSIRELTPDVCVLRVDAKGKCKQLA